MTGLPVHLDVVIAGGGVIGTAIARSILQAEPRLKVCILEKEASLAVHQSGRNSGVVHVGFNQKPGTVKARYVVEGSRRLRQFCNEMGVPLVQDGILVIARTAKEVETLHVLERRGLENGAAVEIVDRKEILRREPYAAGIAALWAPAGASFDARSFVGALAGDARALGAQIEVCRTVTELHESSTCVRIGTNAGELRCRVFVNAGGLHADRLARFLGLSQDYQVVPFRGYYSELAPERRDLVHSHLYACPDLSFPFLGIHLSRNFDGRVRVGPGAILAFGREAYGTLSFRPRDVWEMLRFPGFWRMCTSPSFRRLMRSEWKKSLFRSAVAAEARALVPTLKNRDLTGSLSGIRAQLVSKDGLMVDDLVVESSPRSVHILNAVSPALTCSMPFADEVAEMVRGRL